VALPGPDAASEALPPVSRGDDLQECLQADFSGETMDFDRDRRDDSKRPRMRNAIVLISALLLAMCRCSGGQFIAWSGLLRHLLT